MFPIAVIRKILCIAVHGHYIERYLTLEVCVAVRVISCRSHTAATIIDEF